MKTILPEINFLDTDTQTITDEIISSYENLTGRKLADADPVRLFLLSISNLIVHQRTLINYTAKQNLLWYSNGDVLDHKGYSWDTHRLGATKAKTTFRVRFSDPEKFKIADEGALLTSDGTVFFETIGKIVPNTEFGFVDVQAECTEFGTIGNDYPIGSIDTFVNPLPYIESVQNITRSEGGTDKESDESYRERIRQSPEKLSTAGSRGAYEYWTKTAHPEISDVYVHSPEPGVVHVYFLMENGVLPDVELIRTVETILSSDSVRPLTDYVEIKVPKIVSFDIDVTYYVESNSVKAALIQSGVEEAVRRFALWQKSKIGRDINVSKLISDCMAAGAKRVEVTQPHFQVIKRDEVAIANNLTVRFGGLEDA